MKNEKKNVEDQVEMIGEILPIKNDRHELLLKKTIISYKISCKKYFISLKLIYFNKKSHLFQ